MAINLYTESEITCFRAIDITIFCMFTLLHSDHNFLIFVQIMIDNKNLNIPQYFEIYCCQSQIGRPNIEKPKKAEM